MADERYRKLLGIEPSGEVPTHYELLVLERSVTDDAVIEESYKTQMRKLQSIKSTKDKGFLEFLKEELRTARLTLTNAERRKQYDESLIKDAVDAFKSFVKPLMALGLVPKGVFDTMVAKGVADGLSEEQAKWVIEDLAKQHNATIQTEAAPAAAPPPPVAAAIPDDADPSATHADVERPLDDAEPAYADEQAYHEAPVTDEQPIDDSEPAFSDELDESGRGHGSPYGSPPPPASYGGGMQRGFGETVLKAPAGATPRAPTPPPPPPAAEVPSPRVKRGGFWDAESMKPPAAEEAAPSPWARGAGGKSPGSSSPWSRPAEPAAPRGPVGPSSPNRGGYYGGAGPPPAGGGAADSSQNQKDRWRSAEQQKALLETKRKLNAGAKLARIAGDLHDQLAQYFPPTNGKSTLTYQINGVSFEKVFDSEQKTYRDALMHFEAAQKRLDQGLTGQDVDDLKARLQQNVNLVKGYLEEIRQIKMKRLQPLTKSDELYMWQNFVGSKRSTRLTQTVDEK